MPPPGDDAPHWAVIMPVKALSEAKTRIDPDRGGAGGLLARAFFLDTVEAVRACPRVGRVIVATADPLIAADAVGLGLDVVSDDGHAGINAAARWAATGISPREPVAVIVSDLPSLTPDALGQVLARAEAAATAFLADAEGSGTTMWMAAPGTPVEPRFGAGSARAHREAGCLELADGSGAVHAARRDVDTEADLADALRIGVGAHTRAALDGPVMSATAASPEVMLTVLGRSEDDGIDLADEDGGRHRLPWSAMAAAGFRDARAGQRVVIEPSGVVRLP